MFAGKEIEMSYFGILGRRTSKRTSEWREMRETFKSNLILQNFRRQMKVN